MKIIKSIMISTVLCFMLVMPASAQMMWGSFSGGMHDNNFKIADLDLDGTNELVFLQGARLIVLDNKGSLLFEKTVDSIYDSIPEFFQEYFDLQRKRNNKNNYMMGPGQWHMFDTDYGFMGTLMSGLMNMFGGMGNRSFEIANIDDDANPEIIIQLYDELIVLDHNGDPETTITLP